MDVRQLRYLVAVVEERSISRAAARLHMSQPPLSTAIAQLERELGVTLLDRHARGVEPTEAGAYLVEHAVQLLANLDEVAAAVLAVGTGRSGRVTVAAVSGSGWELLPTLLKAFSAERPDVQIEIVDAAALDVIDLVRSRRADAGFVHCLNTSYLERLNARDLEVAMVGREPLVAVLPARHPVTGPAIDLVTLAEQRWLVPRPHAGWPELAELVRDAWEKVGISPPALRTFATLDTAFHLVEAGFGVALMPASVSRIAGTRVSVRQLTLHLPPIESAVVWRRNERPSPALERFLRTALATPEPDRLGPTHARPTS